MRYCLLPLLLPVSLALPLLPASIAQSQTALNQTRTPQNFWPQAQQLVNSQLDLISRIERSLAELDYNRVEVARGQLIVHTGMVESFLASQYRVPRLLCNNGKPSPEVISDLTLPQRQVYCTLYASTQRLKPVISQLDSRLPMLAGLASPDSIPRPDEPLSNSLAKLREPVTPRYPSIQNFPPPRPPMIGNPTKRATDEELPFQPAIAPPEATLAILKAAREQLFAVLPTFPQSNQATTPRSNRQMSTAQGAIDGLSPEQQRQYDKLLVQPLTGIVRVLPAQNYRPKPNQLSNRLTSKELERFPYITLGPTPSGMTPRFTLQLEQGNFQIPLTGLDYGLIANIGDVSLEKVKPTLQNIRNLSLGQRQFLLDYVPPNQLESLQQDRLRLSAGKELEALVPPVSSPPSTQAPAVLNNTYLLRLFQFRLPEAVLYNEPISRGQRRSLSRLLKTPSSDVLVAFRPISQHSDGSYTVVWRVLTLFPDPKITDLENYVELE